MASTYMTYSLKEVSGIFSLKESRLRYWAATGFVNPSGERRGHYTFRDLIEVKTAKKLLEAGLSLQSVRKHLLALRKALPDEQHVLHRLRISGSKDKLFVSEDGNLHDPLSGQLILDFESGSFGLEVDRCLQQNNVADFTNATAPVRPDQVAIKATDNELDDGIADISMSLFAKAQMLKDQGASWEQLRDIYRDVVKYDPGFAEAYANLGVAYFELGQFPLAKVAYKQALDIDTQLPEVHYNLAALYESLAQIDEAVVQYRYALEIFPRFSDAHYNLARLLSVSAMPKEAVFHWKRFLTLTKNEPGLDEWRTIALRECSIAKSTA